MDTPTRRNFVMQGAALLGTSLVPSAPLAQQSTPFGCVLATGLDYSSSMQDETLVGQMRGLAEALGHPEVRDRICNEGGCVFNLFGWADKPVENIVNGYLLRPESLEYDLRRLQTYIVAKSEMLKGSLYSWRGSYTTNTAAAIAHAHALIRRSGVAGGIRAINIVTDDDPIRAGGSTRSMREEALKDEITVNALIIGKHTAYAERNILNSHAWAFVESQDTDDDITASWVRKLTRDMM